MAGTISLLFNILNYAPQIQLQSTVAGLLSNQGRMSIVADLRLPPGSTCCSQSVLGILCPWTAAHYFLGNAWAVWSQFKTFPFCSYRASFPNHRSALGQDDADLESGGSAQSAVAWHCPLSCRRSRVAALAHSPAHLHVMTFTFTFVLALGESRKDEKPLL